MKQKILAALVISLLVFSFIPILLPTPVYADSVVIFPDKDTYIEHYSIWPGSNHGSENNLRAGHYIVTAPPGGTITDRTLLGFPIFQGNPIPLGATIVSAYLQLYYYDYDGSNPVGDTVYAQRLLRPSWVESVADWDHYASYLLWTGAGASQAGIDYSLTNQSSATVPSSYGWMNWDITAQVQWAWANYNNVQLRVVAASDTNDEYDKTLHFYSREYSNLALRPRLIVNYNMPTALTVTTGTATNITTISAKCYGNIISTGTSTVTGRGIKYGLTQTDTWDSYETGSFDVGEFSRALTSLSSNTTYWYRAYAVNSQGTAYGDWESFTTYVYAVGLECETVPQAGCGTLGNPYIITNLCELNWLGGDSVPYPQATRLDAYYILGNDIDALETSMWYWGGSEYQGFRVIGSHSVPFTGDFNGMGHTISNLYIDRPNTDYLGLFGETMAVTIQNVLLTDCIVTGRNYMGALVGSTLNTTLQNIYVSATVVSTSNTGGYVGVLTGQFFNNTYAYKCYVTGSVSGKNYVGGLVGADLATTNTMNNCYSRASVSCTGTCGGGLAGYNNGNIGKCYSTGTVGGGGSGLGGLIGVTSGDPVTTVTNSFWDTQTSSQGSSSGGTGKTTAQMKTLTTFTDASWDAVTSYQNLNDGYPFLGWQVNSTAHVWYLTGNCSRQLAVASTNYGSVTTPGEGTFCYDPDEVADLVAVPSGGCYFVKWLGDTDTVVDIYDSTTTITMSDNYSITAYFVSEYTLTISSTSGGSVVDPGEGTFYYEPNEVVDLIAVTAENCTFVGWSGSTNTIADVEDPTTTITMDGDYTIKANFVYEELCSLTISSTTGGNVAVPGEGSFAYPLGTVVQITAFADPGYWFKEWTGDIGSIANSLSFITTISMYGNYVITANFVEEKELLPGAPTVITGNATSITISGASLHGTLTDMGSYSTVYTFFQYGLNTSYGTNTPQQTRFSVGSFSATVGELSTNTTYYYRAVGKYDTGLYVYGDAENFTTAVSGVPVIPGYEYYPCGDEWKYEAYETGANNATIVYGADWFYETFTPLQAFKIDSVRLELYCVGLPGALTVSIRNVDNLGNPTGPDLTSAAYTGVGPSTGWYEISLPICPLEVKTYALVVRAVAGDNSNYIGWMYNSAGNYTGGRFGASTSSGISWAPDDDKDFMFETFGTTVLCIMDVKVFSDYLKTGDWLITIHYLNEFPPYYLQNKDIAGLFNLQLISGSAVIAQISVPLWGNMPASIYLSPELAGTLEWGESYTVVMRGKFAPYPIASWTLTPVDWMGSDLTRLDAWVLGVADDMSTYYNTAMTVYTENKEVLNDAGSVFFSIGIPMLANIRPNLFLNPNFWIVYDEAKWTRQYEQQLANWRAAFGDKMVSDAETVGGLFNLQGNQVATAVFVGVWVTIGVGVGAFAGAAALIVSIPFVIIGFLTGILPLALAAILGSLFIIAFILYTWWSKS